jgi:hypothetical protein
MRPSIGALAIGCYVGERSGEATDPEAGLANAAVSASARSKNEVVRSERRMSTSRGLYPRTSHHSTSDRGPTVPAPPGPTRSRSACPGAASWQRRRKPRVSQPVPPQPLARAGRTWDTVTFGGKSPTRAGVSWR